MKEEAVRESWKGNDEEDRGSLAAASPSVRCFRGAVRDLATSGEENRSSKEEESKLLASSSATSLSMLRLLSTVLLLRHSFLPPEPKGTSVLKASVQWASASSLTAADVASTLQPAASMHTPETLVSVSDKSDPNISTSFPESADKRCAGSSSLAESVMYLALFGPESGPVL